MRRDRHPDASPGRAAAQIDATAATKCRHQPQRERLAERARGKPQLALLARLRVEEAEVVRRGEREPDPPARVEAQRVRVEAALERVQREALGGGVEAREAVAERERDPERAVGAT
jgi:hypothetical protein